MKVLQLGKFYPIRGGVEKVMEMLTEGLSARGVDCDMLCASFDGHKEMQVIPLNEHGRIIGCHILGAHAADLVQEIAALMNRDTTLAQLRDIVHIHPTLSEILQDIG